MRSLAGHSCTCGLPAGSPKATYPPSGTIAGRHSKEASRDTEQHYIERTGVRRTVGRTDVCRAWSRNKNRPHTWRCKHERHCQAAGMALQLARKSHKGELFVHERITRGSIASSTQDHIIRYCHAVCPNENDRSRLAASLQSRRQKSPQIGALFRASA